MKPKKEYISIRWTYQPTTTPFVSFEQTVYDGPQGMYVMVEKDRIEEVKKIVQELKNLKLL